MATSERHSVSVSRLDSLQFDAPLVDIEYIAIGGKLFAITREHGRVTIQALN